MAQALTAADRMPERGDVVLSPAYGQLVINEKGRGEYQALRQTVCVEVAGKQNYTYVSRADGGPVTKD